MPPSIFDLITDSNDRLWLEGCLRQNKKTGRTDVVEAVQSRLAELEFADLISTNEGGDTITARVTEAVRVYRGFLKMKHGKNQAAGYTEREIKQHGPEQALIRTIRRGKKTDGLRGLLEIGRLDCSYEQIAIDFAHELPRDVVDQARKTLAELGPG